MEIHNLFDLMLYNDPMKIIKVKLNPLEEALANNLAYKNADYLTRSQKRMLLQDAKLCAIWELKNRKKK